MSKLEEFLNPKEGPVPEGIEWEASVTCQFCGEYVYSQTLYPNEATLVWTCSKGHRGWIEGYHAF